MRVFKAMYLLALLLLGLPLLGCRPAPAALPDRPLAESTGDWTADDLRLLRTVATEEAEDFVVAVGARRSSDQLQFRLDLFESIAYEVYLAIDSGADGARQLPNGAAAEIAWDILVNFSSSGAVSAIAATGNPLPHL